MLDAARDWQTSLRVLFLTLSVGVFCTGLCGAEVAHTESDSPRSSRPDRLRSTHRLLPGIIGRGVDDPNWTRTLHDALATGFSPLCCGMQEAPVIWAEQTIAGGTVNVMAIVTDHDGAQSLLFDDGALRLISSQGSVLWKRSGVGNYVASGDFHADGGHSALFTAGARLVQIDLATGKELWSHTFQPSYVGVRAQVADIIPDLPGWEAALFLVHGEDACLVSFPPQSQPKILWQQRVVDGNFNERYDHHNATFYIDLSTPERPVLWNLRRHRCRGFDARTGNRLSTITYDIGGAQRRNYGPLHVGRGRDGQQLACVFGQHVQIHTHAIRLHRDRDNEMAWQHYYGEVYKEAPGVTLDGHGLVDLDDDGAHEMIYSVRDPAHDFRSIVRVRAADTGEVRYELWDHWAIGAFHEIGPERVSGFLALAAPDGATPRRGLLKVYVFDGSGVPKLVGEMQSAGTWGVATYPGQSGSELLLKERSPSGDFSLTRAVVVDGKLVRTAVARAPSVLEAPAGALLKDSTSDESLSVSVSRGRLRALSWDGEEAWSLPLTGNIVAAVSAADLDDDGQAELLAAADGRLQVLTCDGDGVLRQLQEMPHSLGWHNHHPVVCDLQGDGRLDLLTARMKPDGDLIVQAFNSDGEQLWQTPLPSAGQNVQGTVLNAGQFLPGGAVGVAVSVTDSRRIREGTFMLDGRTGKRLWFKGLHRNGTIVMPCRPNGIPTAFDLDRDGVEEIGMDLLSYMAWLRGIDGKFAFLRHTKNIRPDGALYAGHLYNTFCPLWASADDDRPHWFVTAGFGPFGLIKPNVEEGIWKEDLDYDAPRNIALVDVDGDGKLEAGYAALRDKRFICRDVWTGDLEWSVELPGAPNATTITADFDGDGQGEFFCGRYCLGVNEQGDGEIRWQSPVHFSWPVIADFDGDGQGELAGSVPGKLVVLKANEAQ